MGCEPVNGTCTLLCLIRNNCTGMCQHACHVTCAGASSCQVSTGDNAVINVNGAGSVGNLTVGPGSDVQCESGATCFINCTGACTLECEGGSRCNLKCGAAATIQANAGGSCP